MRRIATADILSARVPSALIANDASQALFNAAVCDAKENKYYHHLYLVNGKSLKLKQLTQGEVNDGPYCWVRGKIVFARSTTDKKDEQVLTLNLMGTSGAPKKLASFKPGSIGKIIASPNGKKLAFSYREKVEFPENKKNKKVPVYRRITNMFYRLEGMGYFDGKYSQLYEFDMDTRKVTQLTNERALIGDFDWLNNEDLVFAANLQSDWEYKMLEMDLWKLNTKSKRLTRINSVKGPKDAMAIDRENQVIYYLGHDDPQASWGTRNIHVWRLDLISGTCKSIIHNFEGTCENVTLSDTKAAHAYTQPPVLSRDGKTVYFLASNQGNSLVYKVASSGGTPSPVAPLKCELTSFALVDGTKVIGTYSDAITPPEVGVVAEKFIPLSDFNRSTFRKIQLVKPEEFWLTADDGAKVHGWIMKPAEYKNGKKYPTLLEVHGGPRAQYGNSFFHEFQLLCANGFAVVYTNPRGSQGYGEPFTKHIVGAWGDRDFKDLMNAVDFAIKNYSFVDADRLGILGGSYGGYMTSWAIGQTDRFKAAVSMRSVNNVVSMAGTSDFGFEDEKEFKATVWDNMPHLWKQSPVAYVKNVKTPLLIIHSEGDLRCPIEQADQFYSFLKQMRKEVEFLRFPEENHDLSRAGRPDRRLVRLDAIVDWMLRHLQKSAAKSKTAASSR